LVRGPKTSARAVCVTASGNLELASAIAALGLGVRSQQILDTVRLRAHSSSSSTSSSPSSSTTLAAGLPLVDTMDASAMPALDTFTFPNAALKDEVPSPPLESPKDAAFGALDYHFPAIVDGDSFPQPWAAAYNPAGPVDVDMGHMGEMEVMNDMSESRRVAAHPIATYAPFKNSRNASTTSLTSLNSNAGLLVQLPDFPTVASQSHSRTSSFSSLADIESNNFVNTRPELSLQTQNLGKMGRMRSSSRVRPYDRRQRSESLSQ
jgi:hypothetical protein